MQTYTQRMRPPVARKPTTARGGHGVVFFIATLMMLIAVVILGPLTGAGQPSGRMSPAFLVQDNGVPSDPLFLPRANYSVPFQGAGALAAADLNGDGKPDVVVATDCFAFVGCDSLVSVLLGNGDGTLQPSVSYDPGGTVADSIAVADVNGDGKPDILVAECGPTECGSGAHGLVGVLLGKGDGTFQPAVTYDSGGVGANSVAVADVNGDGRPDLIVTGAAVSGSSSNGIVGVLLGNGDGTFQPAVTYDTGAGASSALAVAVADLNGDGKPDLIVTNNVSTFGLSVLLGNGDGSFKPAVTHNFFGLGFSIAVADLNGDGKADVVLASCVVSGTSCNSSVSVLLGKGDGTLQRAVNYSSGGRSASSVAIADVNGDNRLDVLVENRFANTSTNGVLGALLGNGDGAFQTVRTFAASAGSTAPWVTVADVNGDGRLDALVGNGVVSVLLNGGAPDATTTTVTTSGSPSILGQPVTLTADARPRCCAGPDGETITFHDGTTVIGSGMTVGGVATFTTSSLKVGAHSIQAVYPGDSSFQPSFGRVSQVVNRDPTTTTLSSSLHPSNYGQVVTLTARITSAGPAPTGTVTFKNGSASLGTGTLNGSGVAILTTAKIPVGANTLTSTYNGDAFNAKSISAAITQTVRQASIHMVLTSTPNPSTFGKAVHFTAKLTSNGSLPAGQPVTFSYNGATLGTANVNSTGVVIFSTTSLPGGSDVVTASYAGSVDYSSASATVTQAVN